MQSLRRKTECGLTLARFGMLQVSGDWQGGPLEMMSVPQKNLQQISPALTAADQAWSNARQFPKSLSHLARLSQVSDVLPAGGG
jgi:hypothetical protein